MIQNNCSAPAIQLIYFYQTNSDGTVVVGFDIFTIFVNLSFIPTIYLLHDDTIILNIIFYFLKIDRSRNIQITIITTRVLFNYYCVLASFPLLRTVCMWFKKSTFSD